MRKLGPEKEKGNEIVTEQHVLIKSVSKYTTVNQN
jgi:hypothetical protein